METMGIICTAALSIIGAVWLIILADAFYHEIYYRKMRRSEKLLRQRLFKLLDRVDEAAGDDKVAKVVTSAVRRATCKNGWTLDSAESLGHQFWWVS